jgi:hypothetical protein
MRTVFIILILSFPFFPVGGRQMAETKNDQARGEREALMRLEDEWLGAYMRGDKAAFDRIVADDFTGTDESGKVRDKAEERSLVQTPPPGVRVSLTNQDLKVRLYKDTAIVTGRIEQKFEGDGGGFNFRSQFTDTFLKREGRWQVAARHYSRVPKERTSVRLEPAIYHAYVGEYEIAPGTVLAVTIETGKLMSRVAGQEKMEMLAESEIEFFAENSDAAFIFVRDEKGTTSKLIINQGGQRITAKRIK